MIIIDVRRNLQDLRKARRVWHLRSFIQELTDPTSLRVPYHCSLFCVSPDLFRISGPAAPPLPDAPEAPPETEPEVEPDEPEPLPEAPPDEPEQEPQAPPDTEPGSPDPEFDPVPEPLPEGEPDGDPNPGYCPIHTPG